MIMKKKEVREAITLVNNGEKIFGIVHRPFSESPVPAVLFCPGFAGNKSGKFRLFVRLAQDLAQMGIAVFRFDYRGAGDSEGDFENITIESQVSDALCCLKFLAEDPRIDRNHLGILGRSLGGVIAILAANHFGSIKSTALWAPVFTSAPWKRLWDSFQKNNLNSEEKKQIQNLPAGIPNLVFLEQFFELNLQNELRYLREVPLLHIEAQKDMIIDADQVKAYRAARNDAGKSRFITLPLSDHDFSIAEEQVQAINETCKWFKDTL